MQRDSAIALNGGEDIAGNRSMGIEDCVDVLLAGDVPADSGFIKWREFNSAIAFSFASE